MKGRAIFTRVVSLSFCVILLLSLAGFDEQEPTGLHLASDGKKVFLGELDADPGQIQLSESDPVILRNPLDEGPCIATLSMLPGLSIRRSGPVDAGSLAPVEARPGSPTVLRI